MGLTAAQERAVERFEADRVAVSAALHLMQDAVRRGLLGQHRAAQEPFSAQTGPKYLQGR